VKPNANVTQKSAYPATERTFTKAKFAKIKRAFVTQSMDDHWFIFLEKTRLYFHRSWTGKAIPSILAITHSDAATLAVAWPSERSLQATLVSRRFVFAIAAWELAQIRPTQNHSEGSFFWRERRRWRFAWREKESIAVAAQATRACEQ
jgi:hypothetical protein